MDMGAATSLGSPASLMIGIWMSMMAATMLPATLPLILAFVQADSRFVAGLWFVASCLAVWLVFGIAAYGLYRQSRHAAAGGLTEAGCAGDREHPRGANLSSAHSRN